MLETWGQPVNVQIHAMPYIMDSREMGNRFSLSLGTFVALSAVIFLGGFFLIQSHAEAATMYVSGTITTSTTWTSDNVYVVNGGVTVGSGGTLTIASGTVVKFKSTTDYLKVSASGTLQVNGSAGNPIYFTSLNDNSVGGTIGSSTGNPAAGDWNDIEIDAGASTTITTAVIEYGSSNVYPYSRANVYVVGGNVTISDTQVSTSTQYGLYTKGGNVTIVSSTFSNCTSTNGYGVYEYGSTSTLAITSSTFSKNTAGAAYLNIANGVNFVPSGNTASGSFAGYIITGTMATNTTWYADSIPYIPINVVVASSTTLTINPGTVMKFYYTPGPGYPTYGSIDNKGTLIVNGTSANKVYFTSLFDNDIQPGTSGSTTSTPQRGDWDALGFENGSTSTITDAIIRYGGNTSPYSYAGGGAELYVAGGSLTLANSQVATGTSWGLYDKTSGNINIISSTFNNQSSTNAGYGIYEYGASGMLSVTSSSFSQNKAAAAYIFVANGVNFIPSGNTASGSFAGFVINGTMSTSATWYADSIPYIPLNVVISSSTTLTINPGTVMKFYYTPGPGYPTYGSIDNKGTLIVNGTSTNDVYFTSLFDNSIYPGTSGSTTSTPQKGDWDALGFESGSSSTISNAIIRYGGSTSPYSYAGGNAELNVAGGNLTLDNLQISSSSDYGIRPSGGQVTLTDSEVFNNTYGTYISSGTISATNNYFHNNSSGEYNSVHTTSSASMEDNYWGTASGPYNMHTNPSGSGDHVSDYVDFNPWLPDVLTGSSSTGNSVYFNGQTAFEWPASNDDLAATDPFTIEFWYRSTTPTSSIIDFLDSRASNGKGFKVDRDPSEGIQFLMNCDSGAILFSGAPSSTLYNGELVPGGDTYGIWHHVAITKGTGTATTTFNLYYDGVAQPIVFDSSGISGNCYAASSTPIWFGRNSATSSSQFLTGSMDEVRIWNSERSSAEITAFWNQEATSTSGLLGLWQFNGTTTDAVTLNGPSGQTGIPAWDDTNSNTPFGHFLMNQTTDPTPAHDGGMAWYASDTLYSSEVSDGATAWNALGGVQVVSTSSEETADLIVLDVSSSAYWWQGAWLPASASSTSILKFNEFYLASSTTGAKQNTAMHELGHAIGLDHSYFGNIMNYYGTEQTTLGDQDIKDFNFLKDEGFWGN